MNIRHNRNASAGFTLLEAVVAVVIIGVTLVPLLELFNGSISSLIAAHRSNQRAESQRNALQVLETVNPSATPSGTLDLGEYTMTWTAQALAPPVSGMAYPNGNGLFDITLFRTFVTIEGLPNGSLEFEIRQTGYARSRQQIPGL